jgi:hypothetical protein
MWKQEEWNFDEFWNCSIDDNIGDPIGNGFVQQRTFRISSGISDQQTATGASADLTGIYLFFILIKIVIFGSL